MKINTILILLSLTALVSFSGCSEAESHGKDSRDPPRQVKQAITNIEVEASLSTNVGQQVATDAVDADRAAVERLLADDLSSVPIRRRHRAQCVRTQELWDHLVRIRATDATYVICAAARLQALWERDLATIRIPERKVPREPVLRAPDGLYYSVYTNRAKLKLVNQETMEIDATKSYLHQLRVTAEKDCNGIDSEYLWSMYQSLDENARRKVMARVTSILGRSPRWEKWQQ